MNLRLLRRIIGLAAALAFTGVTLSACGGDGDSATPAATPAAFKLSIAKNAEGSSITGSYRAELIPTASTANSLALPGGAYNSAMQPYAPTSLDNTLPGYTLTRRINEEDPREFIPASDWKFAKCDASTP